MKKHLKLIYVLVFFIILIPFNSFFLANTKIANTDSDSLQSSQSTALIFGTTAVPRHMDPHYAYDSGSSNVISQVVEHLYEFDLSDPDFSIIPWLASAMPTISPDGLTYTIPLRTGIIFHDGTPFNATSVQWNFYRLMWFINWSGNDWLPAPWNIPVPAGILATQLRNIYMTAAGEPILQDIIVESLYQIKFVLRERKASFLSLLSDVGSGILSPKSVKTQGKQFDYLRYDDNDVLIGTGPFKYQDYITEIQVTFNDNPDYWQGAPYLTDLTFLIFENVTKLSSALLTGGVDLIDTFDLSFISQFEADPDIEVFSAGNTLTCFFFSFNYQSISLAMRKALSWCFNYTYMIDVILEGAALRWPTYIPKGIHYANYSLNYPKFDLSKARDFLLNDAYYGPICAARGLTATSPDSEWINVAYTNPIATWNITCPVTQMWGDISNSLSYNAEYIGVHIDVVGIAFSELINRIYYQRHKLEIYLLGWGPDYLDPENFINPLYSSSSIINGGNFYEPDVQQLMDEGLFETDPVAREAIYQEIQKLMVEEYLPAITLFTYKNYDAWRVGVHGWISNPLGRLFFYPVYLVPEDEDPPETFIDISGILGFDGWYFSDITIYLTASDEGSGVAYTEYSFDEINWYPIDFDEPIIITDDGISTLYYRSVDNVGNVEDTKMEIFIKYPRPADDPTFIYGTAHGPTYLDPYYTYDTNLIEVIDQVVERLFAINLSAPDCGIIPRLASDFGTWSVDGLNYTVALKQGIIFHDGTSFDAASVKWNFDRIDYFMNTSGTLSPEVGETQLKELYSGYGTVPIINRTEIVDTYTIKFVLNYPYGALEALLSIWATGILSPTSTPFDNYMDRNTGDLVGTGPFVYDEYQEDIGVRFHAYEDYWQGPAKLEDLWFLIIPDANARNDALISGIIDFIDNPLTSILEGFETDPNFTVVGGQSTGIDYISMNNNQINKTMRQAISYAINYNYVIDEIFEGYVTRLRSPIPEGIVFANWVFNVATMNITHARKILVDNGVCNFDIYNDAEWLDAAINNPIATYHYALFPGNEISTELGDLLIENLVNIGIQVILDPVTWGEFYDRIYNYPDTIDLFYMGWFPDLNDPSNFLNSLFSNASSFNWAYVNDPYLQNLIDQGIAEIDPVAREIIYDEIQRYLVEDLMPIIYLTARHNYNVYDSRFTGYQWNPLEWKWFYSIYPTGLDLTPPAWNPGDDMIPSVSTIYYTRTTQIIGSIKVYDSSPISNVQLVNMDPPYNGQPDEGFSLSITHYPQDSNNLYWTDVVVMTTNLLNRGEHHLKLFFYDEQGNMAEKSFVVTVYRQLELTLSGEFDYLEAEAIRISVTAYLVDVETGNPIVPTIDLPLTIKIILINPDGNILGTFEMEHLGLGVYRFVLDWTIEQLQFLLTKGIYLFYGRVDFNVANHYYSVKEDVIQFHIDPPSGKEPNLWPIVIIGCFGGLIILYIYLNYLRKHRRKLPLKS